MTTHLCPPCFVRTGQLGLALGMLVLTFFSRLAAAQTGALNLNVVDQDRRVVLGATVVVEDSKYHARRVVATGGERQIVVSLPAPDTYDMVVTADGFADFEQQGITIEAGSTVELSVQMSIAPAKEIVTISTGVEGFHDRLNVAEVRENSARDVGEALSHLEGFSKVRRGGIASDIVLRGFQRDNLNVLIDGSRIYGACPNRMDPVAYHIDFAEVGRIEVLKGAVDMSNQGSLGGVVNILPKTPPEGIHVTPALTVGSFGFYNPSLTASYGREDFKLSGGYSFRTSDPYRAGEGKRVTEYTNYLTGAQDSPAFDIHTGWMGLSFSPKADHLISLRYSRQMGGRTLYPYLLMDADYDNADRMDLKYEVSHPTQLVRALRMQTYFTQVKHYMTDELRKSSTGALTSFSMATNANTRAVGGRVESDMGKGLRVGFEVFSRDWNAMNYMRKPGMISDQNIIPDVATTATGGFAIYQWKMAEHAQLTTGVRVDHVGMTTRSSAANSDLYLAYSGSQQATRSNTTFAGSTVLNIAVSKAVDWFTGIGSTTRFPDAQERYFAQRKMGQDVVGNPALEPTRNTEFSWGINVHNGSFYLKPVLYYSQLTDYIVVNNQPRLQMVPSVMNTAARSYQNLDARMYGGEVTSAFPLRKTLLLSGGTSYTRGRKNRLPAANIFDTHLAEIPPLKGWVGLRYSPGAFFGEIYATATNRQGRVDTGVGETPTPGYGLVNLKAGVHLGKLYATAFVDNLLNRNYYESFSYLRDPFRSGIKVPEPGRGITLAASYSF